MTTQLHNSINQKLIELELKIEMNFSNKLILLIEIQTLLDIINNNPSFNTKKIQKYFFDNKSKYL